MALPTHVSAHVRKAKPLAPTKTRCDHCRRPYKEVSSGLVSILVWRDDCCARRACEQGLAMCRQAYSGLPVTAEDREELLAVAGKLFKRAGLHEPGKVAPLDYFLARIVRGRQDVGGLEGDLRAAGWLDDPDEPEAA